MSRLEVEYLIRTMALEGKTGEPIAIQLPARSIPIAVERHWQRISPGVKPDRWILIYMVEKPPAGERNFEPVEFILHGVQANTAQIVPLGRRLGVAMPDYFFGQSTGEPVVWWSNV